MTTTDYQKSATVNATPDQVYRALTTRIAEWWSTEFRGSAKKMGDAFTVRFGPHYKTMCIGEVVPGKKIVWSCIDAVIDLPELANKREWIGTDIVWEIEPADRQTQVTLTHVGLTREFECFAVCEEGWESFFGSLIALLNTGKGNPSKN